MPIFIYLLLLFPFLIHSESIELASLSKFADALNIEGGRIPTHSLKENQLWANICFILDRPLNGSSELSDLSRNNPYPLKEACIHEYNEVQINYCIMSVLDYYIRNIHEIAHTEDQTPPVITFHIHRNSSGKKQMEIVSGMLDLLYPQRVKVKTTESKEWARYWIPSQNTTLSMRYGYNFEDFEHYEDSTLVISCSLAAGLNSEWPAGTILLPYKFIPLTLHPLDIDTNTEYTVRNHLVESLDAILEQQDLLFAKKIQEKFPSANPEKSQNRVAVIKESDFHPATLLEVDGLFNPSDYL